MILGFPVERFDSSASPVSKKRVMEKYEPQRMYSLGFDLTEAHA